MITLSLDKERHAKCNAAAEKLFKEKTGKALLRGKDEYSWDDINVLIWSCLVWEDASLTVEQVADMVEFIQMRQFVTQLMGNPT
jgi:hypothetical protein